MNLLMNVNYVVSLVEMDWRVRYQCIIMDKDNESWPEQSPEVHSSWANGVEYNYLYSQLRTMSSDENGTVMGPVYDTIQHNALITPRY